MRNTGPRRQKRWIVIALSVGLLGFASRWAPSSADETVSPGLKAHREKLRKAAADLSSSDPRVRGAAVGAASSALGRKNSRRCSFTTQAQEREFAVKLLDETLRLFGTLKVNDEDGTSRRRAIDALGALCQFSDLTRKVVVDRLDEVVPQLDIVGERGLRGFLRALLSLGEAADSAVPRLMEIVEGDSAKDAYQAVNAMGWIGGKRARTALQGLLTHESTSLREKAYLAWRLVRDVSVANVRALIGGVTSGVPKVREAAASMLRRQEWRIHGGSADVAALTDLGLRSLESTDEYVRSMGCYVLGALGEEVRPHFFVRGFRVLSG